MDWIDEYLLADQDRDYLDDQGTILNFVIAESGRLFVLNANGFLYMVPQWIMGC